MTAEQFFREILGITDLALIARAAAVSKIRALRRGELLFRQGEPVTHLYFLVRGIFRGFSLNSRGKEITDCFVWRPGFTVMPSSDLTLSAAIISVEALTPGETLSLPLETVSELLAEYPALTSLYLELTLESARFHWELKNALCRYDAAQRYQWFVRTYPQLSGQVSDKYIASLLDMTPVTLSRLRRKLREAEAEEAEIPAR